MIKIIPAILPKSFGSLKNSLQSIQGGARAVQIDVVDGIFAPNKTWPYVEEDSFQKIVSEDEGLPFWEEFDFEFDLMLAHPAKDAEKFIHAGAARIIIHAKSEGAMDAVKLLQQLRGDDLGIEVGIALASGESAEALSPFDAMYDYVQVMGIEKEGFQGQPFDERALSLVAAVRAAHPDIDIQIDGAVRLSNARSLVEAGANVLVAGSAVFAAQDPRGAIDEMYNKVNATRE